MKLIIGIDPDLDKSGVGIWRSDKTLELECLNFAELLEFMSFWGGHGYIEKVVIEAGWLIKKSNWHGARKLGVAERQAKNVGENHAVGKLIMQMAEYLGLTVQLLKPQGKKNHEEFVRITKYEGRTNPEKRDAGMLVYGMPFKKLGV